MAQPIKKQIWSNLDAFALLNGISTWDDQYKRLLYARRPYENNLDVRDNIYRSNDNRPDITQQGLINALCNEFNITPYNILNKKIFYLSYYPVPSGNINIQDISGYYKTSSGTWNSLGPQIWNENYLNAKQNKIGFIVWQQDKYCNIPNYKNFNYSNIVEVFEELDDKTELKFEYYVEIIDDLSNKFLRRFTDMNNQTDSNDNRFIYRKSEDSFNLNEDILVYTLSDIPEQVKSLYYQDDKNYPTQFYYDLRTYIDSQFKHTWNKIVDNSCIWDIHKGYGSGQISSFYDALAPNNNYQNYLSYTGYIGGIESLSYSLYQSDFLEISGSQAWYLKLYPGKFYLDGIAFYYFENPQVSQLDLSHIGNGIYYANMPSGLERGMHTIATKSGYYDTYYCNASQDEYLSGVYEDYTYYTGLDGNNMWSNIYRRRPCLSGYQGVDIQLEMGQYKIDFNSSGIYFCLPSINGYEKATFIYDNVITPSGSNLYYDLNPLHEQNLNLEKFFMYMTIAPNKYINSNIR